MGLEPTTLYSLDRALYRLGPNLTSHSTPDEKANHQLSMKEKAGVMKLPKTPNTKPSIYMLLMRDEKEERKKQAGLNKQTRQSNTAHPRQSLFLRKMSCLGWDSNPRYTLFSRQSALPPSYQGSPAGWAQISHLIVHLMNRLTIKSV